MSRKKLPIVAVVLIAVFGFFILLGAIFGISAYRNYNSMVKMEENVKGKWGNVENVYQRRADLIPNLVNTVKGYASHERETLESVINARAKATSVNINPENLDPAAIQKFQQAQTGLSSALGRLMVVMERYPDLKANQNFRDLQAQLEGTENRIAVERMRYNEAVQAFNTKIKMLPGRFYNSFFGFEEKGYFEAQEGADEAPEVSFD